MMGAFLKCAQSIWITQFFIIEKIMLSTEQSLSAFNPDVSALIRIEDSDSNALRLTCDGDAVGQQRSLPSARIDSAAQRSYSTATANTYAPYLQRIAALMQAPDQSLPPYQASQFDIVSPQHLVITLIRASINEHSTDPHSMLTALFQKIQNWNSAYQTERLPIADFFCALSPHLSHERVREYLRTAFMNNFSNTFLESSTALDKIRILSALNTIFPSSIDFIEAAGPVSQKTDSNGLEARDNISSQATAKRSEKRLFTEIDAESRETHQPLAKKLKTLPIDPAEKSHETGLIDCKEVQSKIKNLIINQDKTIDKTKELIRLLESVFGEKFAKLDFAATSKTIPAIFNILKSYDSEWISNFLKPTNNYKFLPENYLAIANLKLNARLLTLDERPKTVCQKRIQKVLTHLAEIYIDGKASIPLPAIRKIYQSTHLKSIASKLDIHEVKDYINSFPLTEKEFVASALFALPKSTSKSTISATHENMGKLLESNISIEHFLTCLNLWKHEDKSNFAKFYLMCAQDKFPNLIVEGKRDFTSLIQPLKIIQRFYSNGVISLEKFHGRIMNNPRKKSKDEESINEMNTLFDSVKH